VDSTRKGKSFPDSLSKTIPIWCCVINRAVRALRQEVLFSSFHFFSPLRILFFSQAGGATGDWDESLHLPLWITANERAQLETKLDGFVTKLLRCGVDLNELVLSVRKPLRPLWVNRNTHEWADSSFLTELAFSPVICLTASNSAELGVGERRGWTYVQGAGDDEEAWSCGLTPSQFWLHKEQLLSLPPLECEQLVHTIVADEEAKKAADVVMQLSDVIPLGDAVFLLELSKNHAETLSVELFRRYRVVITSESLANFGDEPREYCSDVSCFSYLPCKKHSQLLIENISDDKRMGHSLERALAAILAFFSSSSSLPLLIVTSDPGVGAVLAAALLSSREAKASKECMKRVLAQVTSAYGEPVYPSRYLAKQLNRFFLSSH